MSFSFFKKIFGKKSQSKVKSTTLILDSLRVKDGKIFIRLLDFTHHFPAECCFFYDNNSTFNLKTGKLEFNPISIDDSDIFYFSCEKKGVISTRFRIDNSKQYKDKNRMLLTEFYKAKN